ncbi:TPA: hypothetical protein ACX3MK_004034 [Raoultella ornithinolytica]
MRSRSPDKAVTPLSGTASPVALRLPGLRSVRDRVARIRRLRRYPGKLLVITVKPAFSIWPASPGRAALTGATERMRSRSPDKAVAPLSGKAPGDNR